MTTYLGKSCSFCLPRVPFVNCRQFMYLVISLLVLRAGYGIWLYQFLIIAYFFTLDLSLIYNVASERLEGRMIAPTTTEFTWNDEFQIYDTSTTDTDVAGNFLWRYPVARSCMNNTRTTAFKLLVAKPTWGLQAPIQEEGLWVGCSPTTFSPYFNKI